MPRHTTPSPTWTAIAASLGFAVVQLDVTIVNVALPRLSIALHSSLAGLQWVVDAYALVFAALLLSAGALGDRYGARRIYIAGFGLFALSSAACGLADSVSVLIAARAFQGLGAALLVPPSLALLNHACAGDQRLRIRLVGLWTTAGAVSIAAGPVLGGPLLESLGWRSIFLVNLPICLLGIGLALRVSAPPRRPHRMDLPGQLLAIIALAGLTGATIEAGGLGWTHPSVLGGFALAFAGGMAFVAVESRSAQPLLPLGFLRLPNFSPAVLVGMAVNLTYYGLIFVLSLYLQHIKGYRASQAGLAYLPLTATFIVSNLLSGRLNGRYGARPTILLGIAITAVGFALMIRLDAASSYAAMLPPFLLIPIGIGLAMPAMTTIILASVEPVWSGTASAVFNAARQAAGAVGVAVFGALAAGGNARIVPGLHTATVVAFVLLLLAWLTVWLGIRDEAVAPRVPLPSSGG